MLTACYDRALEALLSPAVEVLVTKLRVLVISVMSAGMGGVAAGGLKLLDSSASIAGMVGGAAVLSVAMVLDAARFARAVRQLIGDLAGVQKDVDALTGKVEQTHARLDDIESKLSGIAPRTSSAGRSGSFPSL